MNIRNDIDIGKNYRKNIDLDNKYIYIYIYILYYIIYT